MELSVHDGLLAEGVSNQNLQTNTSVEFIDCACNSDHFIICTFTYPVTKSIAAGKKLLIS